MTGVVVVGMHRSGTSAVTRVINLLGVPLGREDDLYSAEDNPEGHWESRSLCDLNDTLLRLFGGWDMAPPHVPARWRESRRVEETRAAMRATFADVYGNGDTWLWKDPRLCLTLPLWREVLPDFCAVFVLRDAEPAARSLHRREAGSYPLTYCRALWDRYNRSAAAALEGLPVVVADYNALCRDPPTEVGDLASGLKELGVDLDGDVAAAGTAVKPRGPAAVDDPGLRATAGFGTDLSAALRRLPRISRSFVSASNVSTSPASTCIR